MRIHSCAKKAILDSIKNGSNSFGRVLILRIFEVRAWDLKCLVDAETVGFWISTSHRWAHLDVSRGWIGPGGAAIWLALCAG